MTIDEQVNDVIRAQARGITVTELRRRREEARKALSEPAALAFANALGEHLQKQARKERLFKRSPLLRR